MEKLKLNIVSSGLSLKTIQSYLSVCGPEFDHVEISCDFEGQFDACVVIDDVPKVVDKIFAKNYYYFGSETIYPVDYFQCHHAINFLDQFDEIFGPYPYDSKFNASLPALPFMYNDNHGEISPLDTEVSQRNPIKSRTLGCYCIISTKTITETQYMRVKLLEYLSNKLGSSFILYGNGFESIDSKETVGGTFTHSIAIENRINPYLISEKYFDATILKNEVFYLGGNIKRKDFSKFTTALNDLSFDQIYREVSERLDCYSYSESEEKYKTDISLSVLQNNFIYRILKNIKQRNDLHVKQQTIMPLRHFKARELFNNPIRAIRWKYRDRFL
jgi:hypothetical protein